MVAVSAGLEALKALIASRRLHIRLFVSKYSKESTLKISGDSCETLCVCNLFVSIIFIVVANTTIVSFAGSFNSGLGYDIADGDRAEKGVSGPPGGSECGRL